MHLALPRRECNKGHSNPTQEHYDKLTYGYTCPMNRRRLSQQQQRRIAAQADREIAKAGAATGEQRTGLVIARYGKRALVEASDGERRLCYLRSRIDNVVAGDRVVWQPSEAAGVIEARDERRSVISRPDARGNPKPLAANIDRMLLVIAPAPEPHANLIDRYLVAAVHAGVAVTLVLNKIDMLSTDDNVSTLAERYQALGYPLVQTGRESDPHAMQLKSQLNNETVILVGQSGVGKSSLIRRLMPDLDIRIGALSEQVQKGRHTTTAAELYHFPEGGSLIDSPGIREFHLHHMEAAQIAQGFTDFEPYLGLCQFRDCRHDGEQGCAIAEAADNGELLTERLESYRLILSAPDP